MPKFHLQDTVALNSDSSFIGSVERTSYLGLEPLNDCLIIAHTDVPADVIQKFVDNGIPPPGYVFVQFASQEKGSSLVAEDDLFLVDRIFDVGDLVKQEGSSVLGTVVNVSGTYILDPIWQPQLTNDGFAASPVDRCFSPSPPLHACDTSCNPLGPRLHYSHPHPHPHPHPHRLIPNVPFEELQRAQDFIEGDYVIEKDWLGVVDSVEMMIVVKLHNNSVVIVADPEELFIPIPDYNKPLVSLPEFDGITRPHYVSAMQGWGNTIPPEDLQCGQFVVTNPRNLRNGRWLRGSYDPNVKPEGLVLMVRCRRLGVQWLMCNAFTPEHHWDAQTPDDSLPYENLSTFPAPQEIRRDKRLVLYDPSKHASFVQDRTRAAVASGDKDLVKNTTPINLSSNFNVGQQVKFRDAAGAAVKYQGRLTHNTVHGRFDRVLHQDTFHYDLNEFTIVHSQQTATIRWQNGSVTEHASTALVKTNLFEADFMPADIVVAREGMRQRQLLSEDDIDQREYPVVTFNEMTFFERPHDLYPRKVGIVQNMHPTERVAQVRWFADPDLRITMSGNALGPESRFGPISDDVEDVSLYEVMSFPALIRKLRDIIVLPPSAPSERAINIMRSTTSDDCAEVNASITSLSHIKHRHPLTLLEWMQHNARGSYDPVQAQLVPPTQYKSHRSLDWVGEICQLRTDGRVVARVYTPEQARDVILEHDQILGFVDEQIWDIDLNEDPMDSGDDSDSSRATDLSEDVLSETVEYEGGERLDDDAGDENWVSEDEPEKTETLPRSSDIEMIDSGSNEPPTFHVKLPTTAISIESVAPPDAASESAKTLCFFLPNSEPPSFQSLEQIPPADQFRANQPPQTSSSFLKRIAKEHRILSSNLPQREIYVRTYDSRLDLLRCLIIGPLDTPYENAPFLIDLHLGPNFPKEPPTAHFHSWTSGLGQINPNLYEEGKICLSLLGTWPGKSATEGWTEKATILQLLVSLQGLVFVKAPFYNEAGFEDYEETKEYDNESHQYSEKAYVMARNFVKHALMSPIAGLEDILAWTYLPRSTHNGQLATLFEDESAMLKRVINRSEALIQMSQNIRGPSNQLGGEDADEDRLLSGDGKSDDDTKIFLRPLSRGAIVMLRKTLLVLVDTLAGQILTMVSTPKEIPTESITSDKT